MSISDSSLLVPVLAAIAGASFSLIGISYRIGQLRRLRPEEIAAVTGLAGIAFFALRMRGIDCGSVPMVVLALGAIAGFTQYIVVKLIGVALARGPLSPIWCVFSLSPMLAIPFSCLAFGDKLVRLQGVGLAFTACCMAFGSRLQQQQPEGVSQRRSVAGNPALVYVITLFATLVLNSLPAIATNYLGQTPGPDAASHMHRFREPYLLMFYIGLAVPLWFDVVLSRRRGVCWSWAVPLGLLMAAGSIVGMSLWSALASASPATLFSVSNVMSILAGSLVSVIFFGERRPAAWYAMIACGVAAVVLFTLAKVLPAG